MIPRPTDGGQPAALADAAFNAVAYASLRWQQEADTLGHLLATARLHGLDDAQLRSASGLDADTINRLIEAAG